MKQLIIALLIIFVVIHRGTQDQYVKYEGMSKEQIVQLIEQMGFTCDFISEEEYNAWLELHNKNKSII